MIFIYFVSYFVTKGPNNWSFGNGQVHRIKPIESMTEVRGVEEYLESLPPFPKTGAKLSLISYQLLSTQPGEI
jgi:hypothetical protein